MWLSLLFSQLIKNNLSNRCRIHKIYPSGPYRILCLFFFSVIITNSYLRARTIQTSSLPNDSSRHLFKQIEIFSAILTVYFSYKYLPLYTRATRVPPLDFAFLAKSLQGQSIPQIFPKSDGERLGTRQESLESWPRGLSRALSKTADQRKSSSERDDTRDRWANKIGLFPFLDIRGRQSWSIM